MAQDDTHNGNFDPAEYDKLLQLERLESLEEEMTELGIASLDEVRARIATLQEQIGDK